jgi:hypothetical protein
MTRIKLSACMLTCLLTILVVPAVAFSQTADLSLRVSLLPDEPLESGDQADIVLTVENLGPDPSGPVRILGSSIVVVSGFNDSVLFRLTPSQTNPCPLFFITDGDPVPGGAIQRNPLVLLASVAPSQSLTCRLRIEVANPLIRASVMAFRIVPMNGSAIDPNGTNNQGSFSVGSDAPRVIPSSGLGALLLLSVVTMLLGLWGLQRRRSCWPSKV